MPEKTMKAAVKEKSAPKSTVVRKVPIPKPLPDEILMRTRISSICGTDVHIYDWDAWSQKRIKTPLIQGHEFAGEIEAVGSAVTEFKKGDYVSAEGHIACGYCYQCRSGNAHVCRTVSILGIDRPGAFAEYMTIPAKNVLKNDPDLPLEYATIQDPLGNAVYTVDSGDVVGKKVAVFGLGPIGLMAVAICKHVGASKVYAVGRKNQYRMDLARRLGADMVLKSGENPVQTILDDTSGEGVQESLEFSGNHDALIQAFNVTMPSGGVHILGIYPGPLTFDINELVTKGLRVFGIHGRRMFQTWQRMGGLLKSGLNLKPILTHRFKLDDYVEAMEVMRSGNCGKVAFPME